MLVALFALLSCTDKSDDTGSNLDCEAIAITTADGEPDSCDVSACQACVDTCGSSCAVLESYPPQYSCGADGSWTVYDFCADWASE